MKSYTGDAIPNSGKSYILVTYEEQHVKIPIVIACGERPALLGRDWLQKIKFGWMNIFSVMSGTMSDIHILIGKYAHLFWSNGSTIQGHTATLKLKPQQNPVYKEAPYARREFVEKDMD